MACESSFALSGETNETGDVLCSVFSCRNSSVNSRSRKFISNSQSRKFIGDQLQVIELR